MKINIQNTLSPILDKMLGGRSILQGVSPLSIGEVFSVQVVEKSGPSTFMLGTINLSILAESDYPLMKGEKLMVKVEQLNPQIILRILNREGVSSLMIRDYTLNYSANPEALKDMFQMGRDMLDQKSLIALLPETTKENIQNVLKIMDASVLSPRSFQNPLFVKDYVYNLGLLLEYNLRKMIEEGKTDTKELKLAGGLKSILMKLSDELRVQMMQGIVVSKENMKQISQLAKFAEASIKTIENQQMINISYKESSGNYILQIPILCPEGIRTGEMFIETDRKEDDGDTTRKRYRVVMFLNMDALGDIMVDVSLVGNKFACLFKFDDPEAQEFFSPFLDDLKSNINTIGYECGIVKCMTSKTIKEVREDYHREIIGDRCEINVLA
jgi:hypothetical protein